MSPSMWARVAPSPLTSTAPARSTVTGGTGINATVSAKDEFYCNPKTSGKHYDLDDVTYVTSVCQGQRYRLYPLHRLQHQVQQKAEGTLAIKVKQTMNFVDVKKDPATTYDSVQWAEDARHHQGALPPPPSLPSRAAPCQIVTFLAARRQFSAPRSGNKFTDVYATRTPTT